MSKLRVPFSKPCFSQKDLEQILYEIRGTLVSGWLTSGKHVEAFEQQFAELTGTSYAVALNSCTAALHAIMLALDVKKGDEVIVPADTFSATANAVVYTGAKPVFADSDPSTFNLSTKDVQRKISGKTKAVVAVHLGGNPCDMKELCEITRDNHAYLVEDCAHAHGASFQGRSCGAFGVAGAFSYYPTKIMTACEGGMVTTDDEALAERIKRIRNCGRGGYGPLEITDLGYNYRLSEVHAIIGLNQLKHLSEFLAHRSLVAGDLTRFLSGTRWIKTQLVEEGNRSSYYAYLIRLTPDAPVTRDDFAHRLSDMGVGTSIVYHPVHTQPLYLKMYGSDPTCPVAIELGKRSLALPIYNGMRRDELDFVKECLQRIIEPLHELIEA